MYSAAVYNRLSEWLANLSLLLLRTVIIPSIIGEAIKISDIIMKAGIFLSATSLWASLRLARVSERRR